MIRVRVLVSVMLLALTGPAAAQAPQKKFMAAPVTIEDQGSFFIGGVTKVTEHAAIPFAPPGQPAPAPVPQQITIGQMYVQFQIPQRKTGPGWPVIMVHGSTHTGAALESTPDGREGWFPYFVRKGVSTYVVDQSGRGRSGFDQSVLHEAESKMAAGDTKSAADLIPNFGRITDNGAWTAWFGHLLPAGSNITNGKLIPHGDASDPEKPTDGRPHAAPKFPLDAAAEYYKQLVPNAEVTLPGSTCAGCTPQNLSPANTWTPQNLALLVERLGGAIVATHSQSGIMGHHMVRILKERGNLHLVKGLITIEGGCSLPASGLTAADFDAIPYLALKGDYTATSAQCQETVDAINKRRAGKQGSARAEYLKLDEMGILGVTHMMMLDTNSNQIADLMIDWVGKNVPRAPKR
ncbi:MAG TPA: hypothetical protein VM819_14095 [Vicinamibacterales bacterium]|nr:hypothetical protein [Vicinamibacterales bacterium]